MPGRSGESLIWRTVCWRRILARVCSREARFSASLGRSSARRVSRRFSSNLRPSSSAEFKEGIWPKLPAAERVAAEGCVESGGRTSTVDGEGEQSSDGGGGGEGSEMGSR